MKHILRDTLISIFDTMGVSAWYRFLIRKKGPLVRVICFHDVEDRVWFENVISMLTSEFSLLTPSQFHAQEFVHDKINILITFDDGYQSWVDTCLPILSQFNVKALFFVNSGLLDMTDNDEQIQQFYKDRLLISPKKPLTWEGAKVLINQGHTIGGHTVTHPNLALLQQDEAYTEIAEDKKRHEMALGILLHDFAFPFGTKRHFTKETIDIAESVGYTRVFSAITGFVTNTQNPIPRTLIEKNQPIAKIRSWMKGGYDIFNFIKM